MSAITPASHTRMLAALLDTRLVTPAPTPPNATPEIALQV